MIQTVVAAKSEMQSAGNCVYPKKWDVIHAWKDQGNDREASKQPEFQETSAQKELASSYKTIRDMDKPKVMFSFLKLMSLPTAWGMNIQGFDKLKELLVQCGHCATGCTC